MSFLDTLKDVIKAVDTQRMKDHPFCSVIVPAAGTSSRMGGRDKLFEPLDEIPVLARTLLQVNACALVDEIVIPARRDDIGRIAAMMTAYGIDKISRIIPGGASRGESVRIALRECSREVELIAVHDGARPLASTALIERCVRMGARTRACVAALPVKDTIKQARDGIVAATPERETLYAAQTPQVFDAALLKAAYEKAQQEGKSYTDDSAAVEALGKHVFLCEGEASNLKITEPYDLAVAARLLEELDGNVQDRAWL